jgi:hypothetical protein
MGLYCVVSVCRRDERSAHATMTGLPLYSADAVQREKKGLPARFSGGWRSTRIPCGLIALAVLVFLWGLGYKLSLYHRSAPHVPRTTVAKLWTGPRAFQLVPAAAPEHSKHAPFSAHAAIRSKSSPLLRQRVAIPTGVTSRRTRMRGAQTLPRSPPPVAA